MKTKKDCEQIVKNAKGYLAKGLLYENWKYVRLAKKELNKVK